MKPEQHNLQAAEGRTADERTAGEKRFDWKTYGGIGYLANVGLSIGAIWAADRTPAGKRIIDSTAKRLAAATGLAYETIRPQVRYTSLLTGGFAVLVPIKLLEDHKIDFVKQFDEQYYQALPEEKAQLQARYEQLEQEPRQTWSSVISSRLLAMVPFYGFTSIAMKENQALARATGGKIFGERLITLGARGVDKMLHAGNPKALAEIATKERAFPNNTVNDLATGVMERPTTALADYTITEATTSSMVAGFLYMFTRLTAPILGRKPQPEPKPFSPVAPITSLPHLQTDMPADVENSLPAQTTAELKPADNNAAPSHHIMAQSAQANSQTIDTKITR